MMDAEDDYVPMSDEEIVLEKARHWELTPYALQKVSMRIQRLARLSALRAPEIIMHSEMGLIARGVDEARAYLDELDAIYGEWRDFTVGE